MFHITNECALLKNGFNFYSLKDKYNFGGKFRIHRYVIYFRYSKHFKKWHFAFIRAMLQHELPSWLK